MPENEDANISKYVSKDGPKRRTSLWSKVGTLRDNECRWILLFVIIYILLYIICNSLMTIIDKMSVFCKNIFLFYYKKKGDSCVNYIY